MKHDVRDLLRRYFLWQVSTLLRPLGFRSQVGSDPTQDKEYQPIDGKPEYKRPVQELLGILSKQGVSIPVCPQHFSIFFFYGG